MAVVDDFPDQKSSIFPPWPFTPSRNVFVAWFDDVASSSFFPNSVEMVEMVERVVQYSAIGVVNTDVMIE